MYEYGCDLDRVVDGDTIDVILDLGFNVKMKERVRLSGVDTPEIWGPNASPEGPGAKQWVEDWFQSRTLEGCTFRYCSYKYNQIGKYGRSIGCITAHRPNSEVITLNDDLLSEGIGEPYS